MAKPTRNKTSTGRQNGEMMWNAIDELRTDNGAIKTMLATVGSKIDTLDDTVHQIIKHDRETSKTPWANIFAAIAILFSIGLSIGGAALAPLYLADGYQSRALQEHLDEPGHAIAMQLHAGIAKDIERLDGVSIEMKARTERLQAELLNRHDAALESVKALDTSLQREMRDLDNQSTIRLDNLDRTLQREMRMLNDITEAKSATLKERIMALERSEYGQTIDQRDNLRD